MRRIIAIPLLIIYLLSVSGLILTLHFCNGRYNSFNLVDAKSCCCEEAPPSDAHPNQTAIKNGCCSNKYLSIKISSTQLTSNYTSVTDGDVDFIPFTVPNVSYAICTQGFATDSFLTAQRSNAPPGTWQYIPLYSLFNSRILYS